MFISENKYLSLDDTFEKIDLSQLSIAPIMPVSESNVIYDPFEITMFYTYRRDHYSLRYQFDEPGIYEVDKNVFIRVEFSDHEGVEITHLSKHTFEVLIPGIYLQCLRKLPLQVRILSGGVFTIVAVLYTPIWSRSIY